MYIAQISIHGLVRGTALELGRDADTGGQVKYVVDLVRRLAGHEDVDRVDLYTRQIFDKKVSEDYSVPIETLGPGAQIVRLPCGPRRYFRKEVLWPHLDSFVDQMIGHIRKIDRIPDIIHGHYADGGYVGLRLAGLLGVPFIFTGHSLGRVKRRYLLEQGRNETRIDAYFHLPERIEAEEEALAAAAAVVTSTQHEIETQYKLYDHYRPGRKVVIPPGTDLEQLRPDGPEPTDSRIAAELRRFLREPDRPMILTVARPDERKNLDTLVRAYAENARLREMANLVIVAGNRDDIREMDPAQRRVLNELLLLIDRYDLYGHTAMPKKHAPEDVPVLFRLAVQTGGVFVLPTRFELFGLTLIEAAASGLPVVATNQGGPPEIVEYCENGQVVDPDDARAMGIAIESTLTDHKRWKTWSRNGIERARKRYSWESHVAAYLGAVRRISETFGKPSVITRSRLPKVKRMLISDIDNTLLGDREALGRLTRRLQNAEDRIGFGVATGRTLDTTMEVLDEWGVRRPDVVITSVGSEIYYGGSDLIDDRIWLKHINYRWKPDALRSAMASIPGVELQEDYAQRPFKVSYYVDTTRAPSVEEIKSLLRKADLSVNVIFSHGEFLDVLPIRASKGRAVRWVAVRWRLPLDQFLVAGDSGNDIEMLTGDTLGVVVGNHSPEVEILRDNPGVYFAEGEYAAGIIEGMDHYDFFSETPLVGLTARRTDSA